MLASLALALAAVSAAPPAPRTSGDALPTGYVYAGERVELVLDGERLLVRSTGEADASAVLAAAGRAGVPARGAEPSGVPRWVLLELETPSADAAQAAGWIGRVCGEPEVDFASPVFHGPHGTWSGVTPSVLVRFGPALAGDEVAWLAAHEPDLVPVEADFGGMPGAFVLASPAESGFAVLAAANRMAESGAALWAEPDMQFTGGPALVPNDALYSQQWALENTGQFGGTPGVDVNAEGAWDLTTGSASIQVVVIDTGVETGHPDLNLLPGIDVTGQGGGGAPVNAFDNHGTPVAGCVSAVANNALGVAGMAPGCPTRSARTFITVDASGSWCTSISWTVNSLNWAALQGVRVSVNSNFYGFQSGSIANAYVMTRANGMVHFAAAGNFAQQDVTYPASLPSVQAIGAIDWNGDLASFSNWGDGIALTGPGLDLLTTDRTGSDGWSAGDYVQVFGTSFACPIAAGIAALRLSLDPGLAADEVERILACSALDLGAPGRDEQFGAGLVDALAALQAPVDPGYDCLAFSADVGALSLLGGGVQVQTLEAGSPYGGLVYWIAGSASGTQPGISTAGMTLPLNPDLWFQISLLNYNLTPFSASLGLLDGNGGATAGFVVPPAAFPPELAGVTLHHAFTVIDVGFTAPQSFSNAIPITFLP